MNVGIIGLGSIAKVISKTINALDDKDVSLYACASRSIEKAEAFKKTFGFLKAYGDYESLLADQNVDLVYVATPHAFHYDIATAAINAGKNVIVEKPITTDEKKLERLIALAEKRGVFLTEAFWTAFDPLVIGLKKRLDENVYGKTLKVTASFGLPLCHVKRLTEPALGGGALLDLGVYCAFYPTYFGGAMIDSPTVTGKRYKTGVDLTTKICATVNGFETELKCSFARLYKNDVVIDTEKAVLTLSPVNFPTKIVIKDKQSGKKTVEKLDVITGYEYEFLASKDCISSGKAQTEQMPLSKSLRIISLCDEVRRQMNVVYPFDEKTDL